MVVTKHLLSICLLCLSLHAFCQDDLAVLEVQRAELVQQYKATPKRSIERKIDKVETEVVRYIEEKGYVAKVKMEFDFAEIDVKDQKFLGKKLESLKKGDSVTILERLESGHFKVKTADNQIGYLYHQDFEPSIKAFPFDVLIGQVEKKEAERNFVNPNLPPHTRSYSAIRERGCSKVQCSSMKSNGARCQKQTTECDERCDIH